MQNKLLITSMISKLMLGVFYVALYIVYTVIKIPNPH